MGSDRGFPALCTVCGLLALILMPLGCKRSAEPSAQQPAPGPAAQATALPAIPLGLPPLQIPPDNPMTEAKVELGSMLYFDKRLSKDGTISCATCHDPKLVWAEDKPVSIGIHEQAGKRNSPTVINAAYLPVQFWDGRAATLEEQALGPIENPLEMGSAMVVVREELAKDPEYVKRFEEVFGSAVTDENIAKAIAAFERTVLSGNSPYDRWKNGQEDAMTDQQERGWEVFADKGGCATCHAPPIFTNGRYYNAGIGMDKAEPDEGRKDVTGQESDLGRFRVPPLREVAGTAPYFHDGSVEKLADAVDIMASGGKDNPNLSAMMKAVREASLTDQDRQDLVAFLNALSGEYPVIEPPSK